MPELPLDPLDLKLSVPVRPHRGTTLAGVGHLTAADPKLLLFGPQDRQAHRQPLDSLLQLAGGGLRALAGRRLCGADGRKPREGRNRDGHSREHSHGTTLLTPCLLSFRDSASQRVRPEPYCESDPAQYSSTVIS